MGPLKLGWDQFWRIFKKHSSDVDDPNMEKNAKAAWKEFEDLNSRYGDEQQSESTDYIGKGNVGKKFGNFLYDLMEAGYRDPGKATTGDYGTIENVLGFVIDRGGIKNFKGAANQGLSLLMEEVLIYLEQQKDTYIAINEEAAMTGELAEAYREELLKGGAEAVRWGITVKEMTQNVGKLVANSGKFKLLSKDTIGEMALTSKFTKDLESLTDLGGKFERVGLGIRDMNKLVQEMSMRSLTLGLNGKKTVELIDEHLAKLNTYGFKDGIKGMAEMARKAVEFRMDMGSVLKFADKVWEPDKALELVANLQVIGGAFGDLNDPIKLMYMATNNVEGLQDALIGASQSLVTFNEEQGRFEVQGANLRRLRAMADEAGMGYEEMSNMAVAGAERMQASMDLMGISNISDEDREFITNLARMEDGRMIIEIPESLRDEFEMSADQTSLALDELTEQQIRYLGAMKDEFESMSAEEIAEKQVTLIENIQRDLSFIRATARVGVGNEIGNLIERLLGIDQDHLSVTMGNFTNKVIDQMGNIKNGYESLRDKILNEDGVTKTTDLENSLINWLDKTGTGPDTRKEEQRENARITAESNPINLKAVEDISRKYAQEAARSSSNETKKIEMTISPTQVSMDEFARALMKDQKALENVVNSFLHPNSN